MEAFSYTARGKDGKIQKGVIQADTKEAALASLMARGLLVTSLEDNKKGDKASDTLLRGGGAAGFKKKRRLHHAITAQDMMMFSRQLATMLEAGVTLIKALNVILAQVDSKRLLKILKDVKKEIESGKTLQNAMSKYPKVFTTFWLNLVEIGEASGHLAQSLNEIAIFLEGTHKVREKIISALIYPAILVTVAIGAILIFVTKIVPIFAGILTSFQIELPALTKGVIWFSQFLNQTLFYVFAVLLASFALLTKAIQTPKGKFLFDRFVLKIPIVGDFLELVYCERMASSLGTLLQSGVSILHALDIAEKTMGNSIYQIALQQVKEQVRQGKSFSIPLERSGLFPPVLVQMVSVGEEVGELDKMLLRFSTYYKEKMEMTISRLTSLIEPAILIIMGGVISILVISMFLPIFKLTQIGSGG
ncbi:MAG: type II secretion system F family protein [Candidatus Omnitrophica bacterium]|nr:type II secretion system F family protein [Candidatus Omnitrophota bacterium]